MNPPELSSQNWLLLSFSNSSPNHHHLQSLDAAGSPCHRLSVIDQGKNGWEFAAKYSKKCWIYHFPAPKWYCFSKSISFSIPWFNGFLWFMKYFLLPRAYCKHLYKIEFLIEQVTFLLNFNISRRKKGVFPTQIFFEQVFKWVSRCQDLSSADSQYNHQLVKQTLKFTPVESTVNRLKSLEWDAINNCISAIGHGGPWSTVSKWQSWELKQTSLNSKSMLFQPYCAIPQIFTGHHFCMYNISEIPVCVCYPIDNLVFLCCLLL